MSLNCAEQELLHRVSQWLDLHEDRMVEGIMRLVKINSVCTPAADPYPYGKGCAEALEETERLAAELGFTLTKDEYQYGLIHLPGVSNRSIGLFNHLDVVPPGDGWLHEPFTPFLHQGHIFGRGASDNKGPSVASLFLLKCLRDLGIALHHSITLFLGCNEETGMKDIDFFLARNPAPFFGISPDATYPVCRGEKGRMLAKLTASIKDERLISFEGGVSEGMVPASASMVLAGVPLVALSAALPEGVEALQAGAHVRLQAKGIAAHAGTPEGSRNAIGILAEAAAALDCLAPETRNILRFIAHMLADYYGEGPGIAFEDFSGKLTHVGGILRLSAGQLTLSLNIRCPVTADFAQIQSQLEATCAPSGLRVTHIDASPGYCLDADDPIVQALNDSCNCVWEVNRQPLVLGGGTYARKLPRALAFGCSLPGIPRPAPEGHGYGHQPDECVSVEAMRKSIQIYALSLVRLDQLLNAH